MKKIILKRQAFLIEYYDLTSEDIKILHSDINSVVAQMPISLLKNRKCVYITKIELNSDFDRKDAKNLLAVKFFDMIEESNITTIFIEIDFQSILFSSIEDFYFYIGELISLKRKLKDSLGFKDFSYVHGMAGKRLAMIYDKPDREGDK